MTARRKLPRRRSPAAGRRSLDSTLSKEPLLVVDRIGCCVTLDPAVGDAPLGTVGKAAVALRGDRIAWVGPRTELPKEYAGAERVDAAGALVTPGLVDCHTHLLFAGTRADEFFLRLSGASYEEIARRGGGIQRTVSALAAATDAELLRSTRERLDQFLASGVTTVEIKTGYGLSLEQELRSLGLIRKLNHAADVIPTFLGAHTIPSEWRGDRKGYVKLVMEEMLPAVAAKRLSRICDVFLDDTAFTLDEARTILSKALQLGLGVKVHADQMKENGGAELAAELGALSADHLECVSNRGVRALAKKGVVGVLLPGAVFFLGKRGYAPARKLLEAGVRVAISTDSNPGTSMTQNLPLMMTLAAVEMKMTAEEIWPAVTAHAAQALGLVDRGQIMRGALADLVVWDAQDPEEIPYRFGTPRTLQVVRRGTPILPQRCGPKNN
ncbi:MAG: imidazolonepropionase [Pseudomonadota bacterium]